MNAMQSLNAVGKCSSRWLPSEKVYSWRSSLTLFPGGVQQDVLNVKGRNRGNAPQPIETPVTGPEIWHAERTD